MFITQTPTQTPSPVNKYVTSTPTGIVFLEFTKPDFCRGCMLQF
jgi:hypothetical protein